MAAWQLFRAPESGPAAPQKGRAPTPRVWTVERMFATLSPWGSGAWRARKRLRAPVQRPRASVEQLVSRDRRRRGDLLPHLTRCATPSRANHP